MEVLLTTGLVNTVLGTASGARNIGTNGAIAVGGYIALAGLWAAPISGASMNPVRSLAPDLLIGDFSTAWIYLIGPLVGAMIAVAFEGILKGPPTTAGTICGAGHAGGRRGRSHTRSRRPGPLVRSRLSGTIGGGQFPSVPGDLFVFPRGENEHGAACEEIVSDSVARRVKVDPRP